MAQPLSAPYSYFADANGAPLAGGLIYTYIAGTTTPQATYTDSGAGTPLSNPVVLDSAGRATIWLNGYYKIVVKDSLGNTISTTDNITGIGATGDMTKAVYDPASINEQLVGLTATQTLSNKSATTQAINNNSTLIATTAYADRTSLNVMGGFVNKFRNNQMVIAQRGTSGTVTTGNTNYTLDGWLVGATGATVSWSQGISLSAPNFFFPNYLNLTGNTSMTDTFVEQRIESNIASVLSALTVTVQATILNSTSATLTPTLTIQHAGSTDNWGSPVTDVNAVNLQSISASTYGTVAYTFTADSSSGNGLLVKIDFGAALNANTKSIGISGFDIRITPGVPGGLNSSPPSCELRPVHEELLFSQRYFVTTFGNGVTPAQGSTFAGALGAQPYGATAGELYTQWNFPVPMRIAPTITTYNPNGANANWRDKTGGSDVVVSVDPDTAIGTNGVLIGSQTTALTAGHRCYIHASATSEL